MMTRRHLISSLLATAAISAGLTETAVAWAQDPENPTSEGEGQTAQPGPNPNLPPRVRTWGARPGIGSFSPEEIIQTMSTFSNDNGQKIEQVGDKYLMKKPEGSFVTQVPISTVDMFNGELEVITSEMKGADPKDYIAWQVGIRDVVVKYLMRPKTHEIYMVRQNVNDQSGWDLMYSWDFVNYPKDYYDVNARSQRLQFVWNEGIYYPLVNGYQVYNNAGYPEPYRADQIQTPAVVSVLAYGNPNHSFTGVVGGLYFEGKNRE